MLTTRRRLLTALGAALVSPEVGCRMLAEPEDEVFTAGTARLKVGTVASPSSIPKTIRMPAHEFVPATELMKWSFNSVEVTPNLANTALVMRGPAVLPKGVTIVALRARLYRQTMSDQAFVDLYQIASDAPTTLASVIHNTTGYATLSASLSQLVGDEAYSTACQLIGVASLADARLEWVELDYTMPDYSRGY